MTATAAKIAPIDPCDEGFRLEQAQAVLAYAFPRCVDRRHGGFVTALDDGGSYDPDERHLVQQARYTVAAALGYRLGLLPGMDLAAAHGLSFLRGPLHDGVHGGWFWSLRGREPEDRSKQAYGHAFALLAAAVALEAGFDARDLLDEAWHTLDRRFWREDDGLYVDTISEDWSTVDPYRGQNANMHLVEALLAAHAATGWEPFLDRAATVARRVTVDLPAQTGGLLWEHYDENWTADLDYHRDVPRDMFRPWGVLTGHLMEWAKLLVHLHRARPEPWQMETAAAFFDAAIRHGHDPGRGGLVYSFDLDGNPVDTDRYHWTIAEAIGAAAALAAATGDPRYRDWHRAFWDWALAHQVDRERGGWLPALDADGRLIDLPFARGKPEVYHPLGACLEACVRR